MLRFALLAFVATLVALSAGASAASLLSANARVADVQVAIDVPAPDASAPLGLAPATPGSKPLLPALPLFPPPSLAAPLAPIVELPASPIAEPPATIADARAAEPAAPVPAEVQTAAGAGILWLIIEKLGLGRILASLYFRVQPNELLDHERRERVMSLVRERPGIGPQDVAQALGTGWGVTSYHLDRLERAGLVTSQRVGQHRCYFLPGAVPRGAQHAVGLFRGETTRRLAQLVAAKPGLTQSQLCAELGLSPSAASKQISRLEAAALVRREAVAGGQRVFPAETLAGALMPGAVS